MAGQVVARPCTWRDVPGYFDFDELYGRVVAKAPATGARFVEIGVLYGRSTMFMADAIRASGKQISFDAVDNFASANAPGDWQENFLRLASTMPEEHAAVARQAIFPGQTPLGEIMFFLERANLEDYVSIVGRKGQDQAACYQDNSLDFVFVDASHTYDDTKEIILAYLPKIKDGGILAGHDYAREWPGVMKAVDEIFKSGKRVRFSIWSYNKPKK